MTGGNQWISHILASLDINGPVHDPENIRILDKGPAVLTLDLSQGEAPKLNGAALKAGSDRAKQQLLLAATIKGLTYDAATGALSFTIQNNTAHKLISGFPEGRRMFINIKAYNSGSLIYEVNPYDYNIGTLKGLPHSTNSPLGPNEVYVDELVYEVHPSSALTGEDETFHFVLADGRYKDNRIPPKGFKVAESVKRLCEPVWHGESAPNYFTEQEYAGGYDAINLNILPGADYIEATLYYQGTSREYIEFLRDEINGDSKLTLPTTPWVQGPGDPQHYIIQSDPFFAQLSAWGNVIWELWLHNHGLGATQPTNGPVKGIVPFQMTQATLGVGGGCTAPIPAELTATSGDKQVILAWQVPDDPDIIGSRLYYDQSGKAQLIADLPVSTNTYTDTGLTNGQEYCYKVTSYYADCESGFSNIICATPNNQGQTTDPAGVDTMVTGVYSGGGKNKTFNPSTNFEAGASIVIRARVIDRTTSTPLANATVDIEINGPEITTLTSGPSDAEGYAEATWNTQAPNKKGQGGTTLGLYTASTIDVKASGYHWDSVTTSIDFVIQ
jgi:hypothetical protein